MAHYLLEHVADHRRTLGEMARVLRPGGLLVLTFPNPSAPEAVMTRATPLGFHRAFKWIVQGTKDVEKHVFPTVFSFRTVRNVETTLRENGCGAVRTGYLSETYYRFRRWLVPGYLALVYSRALDLLHVRFLKSSVVICACKDRS
jgi:ubiquinone/menaquinone biosynthesis C-methylase UbiE